MQGLRLGLSPGLGLSGGSGGGGGGIALPAGAIGVWYADQYTTSPRPHVPNEITKAANPLGSNLISGSRGQLANTIYFAPSATATGTGGFTSADGSPTAVRIVGTGNWSYFVSGNCELNLPAGTYTVAAKVKSNTGSSQDFRLTSIGNFHDSGALTATTSWQRFSFTTSYTAFNGERPGIRAVSGGDTNDLLVSDLEFYAGAADLGPQTYAGHLILGRNAFDPKPSYASGVLDMSTGGFGLVQFSALASFSKISVIALFSKIASGGTYEGFMADASGYLNCSSLLQASGLSAFFYGGNPGVAASPASSEYSDWLNAGWHVMTHTYDSAGVYKLWVDDVLFGRSLVSTGAVDLSDFLIGLVANIGNTAGYKLTGLALYDRDLSATEVRQAYASLATEATSHGNTITPPARFYAAEGDSITGTQAYCYPFKFKPNASPSLYGTVIARGGESLSTITARAAVVDSTIPPAPARNGRTFILSVLIGANDLGTYTGATDAIAAANFTTDLAAYCDARRAAGWKVVVCTILPRGGVTAHNARRAIVNANITGSWLGVHCDAIADFAADPTMGTDTSFADNPAKWADATHPNSAGHVILETIIRPVINGL